jgi:ribosomal protein S18 acetylase RimI-like enzyme
MSPEKDDLTVHPATSAEVTELARLVGHFADEPLTAAQMTSRMTAAQEIETAFLARRGDQVAGVACLKLTPSLSAEHPQAEVTELFIEKAYQENGVERALLETVESLARQRGARQVILHTGLKNTPAQALYRSLGYHDSALAMRKLLPEKKD